MTRDWRRDALGQVSRAGVHDGRVNSSIHLIIIEVLRRLMAQLDRGGLQLQPVLIIEMISAATEILQLRNFR
jgi:hypothetical protein